MYHWLRTGVRRQQRRRADVGQRGRGLAAFRRTAGGVTCLRAGRRTFCSPAQTQQHGGPFPGRRGLRSANGQRHARWPLFRPAKNTAGRRSVSDGFCSRRTGLGQRHRDAVRLCNAVLFFCRHCCPHRRRCVRPLLGHAASGSHQRVPRRLRDCIRLAHTAVLRRTQCNGRFRLSAGACAARPPYTAAAAAAVPSLHLPLSLLLFGLLAKLFPMALSAGAQWDASPLLAVRMPPDVMLILFAMAALACGALPVPRYLRRR